MPHFVLALRHEYIRSSYQNSFLCATYSSSREKPEISILTHFLRQPGSNATLAEVTRCGSKKAEPYVSENDPSQLDFVQNCPYEHGHMGTLAFL